MWRNSQPTTGPRQPVKNLPTPAPAVHHQNLAHLSLSNLCPHPPREQPVKKMPTAAPPRSGSMHVKPMKPDQHQPNDKPSKYLLTGHASMVNKCEKPWSRMPFYRSCCSLNQGQQACLVRSAESAVMPDKAIAVSPLVGVESQTMCKENGPVDTRVNTDLGKPCKHARHSANTACKHRRAGRKHWQ